MSVATDAGRPERMPIAILALAAVNFAIGTQGFVFAGLLNELAQDLGVTSGRAGVLVGVASVVFAVMAPIAILVTARIERKFVILWALTALLLLNMASWAAPDFGSLLLIRVLIGVATAFGGALVSAAVGPLVAPERRGKAFALVVGGMTVAFTIGIPIGSVVGGMFGWRATFLFGALIVALAIVLVATLLPRVEAVPAPRVSPAAVFANREVTVLIALGFFGFTAMFSVVAFIGPLINHTTGFTGAAVGFFQIFIGIGSIAGLAVGGLVADRGNIRTGLAGVFAAIVASLLGYGILLAQPSGTVPGALVALSILVGAAALFSLMPMALARLSVAAGAMAPMALSVNASMNSLGQGAGAFWGGFVKDALGFAMTGPAGAVIGVLGIALALSLSVRRP